MRVTALVGMAAVLLTSGCAGPMFEGTIFEQPAPSSTVLTQQKVDADVRLMREQVEAVNRSLEVLNGRMDRLEAQVNTGAHSSDDLVAMRRDIQLVRADRETLKKEITDDLAARVEKIAARQQAEARASRPAAAPAAASVRSAGTPSSSGRGGYEHKVEKGQTLSEIARGYGKSVDSILKANKITNPSSIRVGQVLFIPD